MASCFGRRDVQDATNAPGCAQLKLMMPRHGRLLQRTCVNPNVVVAAMVVEKTAVESQVPLKVSPLHSFSYRPVSEAVSRRNNLARETARAF